jgi:hypothetical protein
MQHRPDYVRSELQRYFDAGDSFTVNVRTDDGTAYRVDGYAKHGSFEGKYFADQTVIVEAGEREHHAFSHWLVNGRRVEGERLAHSVTSDAVIESVFVGL